MAKRDAMRDGLVRAGMSGMRQWRRATHKPGAWSIIRVIPCGECHTAEDFTKAAKHVSGVDAVVDMQREDDDGCYQVWPFVTSMN